MNIRTSLHGRFLFRGQGNVRISQWSSITALLALAVSASCAIGQTSSPWGGELQVSNAATESQILRIGQDPSATEGIDWALGEEPLPPPPPSTVFEGRLVLPDGEASRLDLRPFGAGTVSYTVKWQAGLGGYPVTLTWDPAEFPSGTELSDGLGGVFVGPIDMTTLGTVVVGSDMFFLQTLTIEVSSTELENTPPALSPFVSSRVFAGQRARTYSLDEHVADAEDSDEQLLWRFNPGTYVSGHVSESRELSIDYPEGWTGQDTISLEVEDTGGFVAQGMVVVEVMPEVFVPQWEFALTLSSISGEGSELVCGHDPSATDGLDTAFGELELPPWPPTGVFDARLWNSAAAVDVRRDFRHSPVDSSEYQIAVQFGDAGEDLAFSWDPNLVPPGRWTLSSVLGGLEVDLRDFASGQVVVQGTYPIRLDLALTGRSLVDVAPPAMTAVRALWDNGGSTLRIFWDSVSDPNFDFYDIILEDGYGTELARFDRWNVPSLRNVLTTDIEVAGISPADLGSIVLIAWDNFGHGSTPVEVSAVPGQGDLPSQLQGIRQVYPNPFNPHVFVEYDEPVGRYDLSVYDIRGRRVSVVADQVGSGRSGQVASWDGCDDTGAKVGAGNYYFLLRGGGEYSTAAVVLIK